MLPYMHQRAAPGYERNIVVLLFDISWLLRVSWAGFDPRRGTPTFPDLPCGTHTCHISGRPLGLRHGHRVIATGSSMHQCVPPLVLLHHPPHSIATNSSRVCPCLCSLCVDQHLTRAHHPSCHPHHLEVPLPVGTCIIPVTACLAAPGTAGCTKRVAPTTCTECCLELTPVVDTAATLRQQCVGPTGPVSCRHVVQCS